MRPRPSALLLSRGPRRSAFHYWAERAGRITRGPCSYFTQLLLYRKKRFPAFLKVLAFVGYREMKPVPVGLRSGSGASVLTAILLLGAARVSATSPERCRCSRTNHAFGHEEAIKRLRGFPHCVRTPWPVTCQSLNARGLRLGRNAPETRPRGPVQQSRPR